ncbi:MAG TPA: signal peptidase II [Thermoanaerobaculia bacterium]|jgi:signal peptidase II|nr:signal peptidase II [Thermoanaerobaculia bacterium]
MTTRWRLALLSLVMLICVGCDQAAKAVARDSLAGRTISLLGGAVRFEYAENMGAFLSLGSSLPSGMRSLLFVGGTGLIVLGLLVAMARGGSGSPSGALGLALLAGGAVGNLIDRVAYDGAVVDFVSVGLGSLRTGIFNLADVAITVGVVLVALQGWRTASSAEPAGTR